MKLLSCLMLAVLAVACSAYVSPLSEQLYQESFTKFMQENSKTYEINQLFERYTIFKSNLDFIREHNSQNHTYTVGVNAFADLTTEEFTQQLTGLDTSAMFKHWDQLEQYVPPSGLAAPAAVDWRSKSTGVKNQGSCGSCWAFSAVAVIESYLAIKKGGAPVSLSQQQLVDCSGSYGNHGCNGGLPSLAYKYVAAKGLCTASAYPYTAKDNSCKTSCNAAAKVSGGRQVTTESALVNAIAGQPVSIGIYASSQSFQLYKSGIYSGPCAGQVNHAVVLNGYNTNEGWYRLLNSWGTSWGESGYMRIRTNQNTCGLTALATFPY